MDVEGAIRSRRSIRRYQKKDVSESLVRELIDLARHAPSSMNGQPWHFTVVRGDQTKRKLVQIKNKYCPVEKQTFRADFIQHAPVIVVLCVDRRESYDRGIENGVFAAANILLAAHNKGLGSVYMSAYRTDEPGVSEEIRHALGIPAHMDPVSILPLGYPDEIPEAKDLKPLNGILSHETFSNE